MRELKASTGEAAALLCTAELMVEVSPVCCMLVTFAPRPWSLVLIKSETGIEAFGDDECV